MDAIKNLNLTWIKSNKDLALHIVSFACLMYSVNYGNKRNEYIIDFLIKAKEQEAKVADQNNTNSLLMLKLIDKK